MTGEHDEPSKRSDRLILDEVTEQLDRTFKLLRGDSDQAADLAFAQIGVNTVAEARLVAELADREPLAHPDRFADAHRLTMRALEVLDREGFRHPKLARMWVLTPVAERGVEYVARYVVRSHVANVVRNLARLYARRESQSEVASPQRRMLAQARIQADRLSLGYRGARSPLTGVLAGGAAIPVVASVGRRFGAFSPGTNKGVLVAVALALILVFGGLAWILLQGAGLAHRRVIVISGRPVEVLWETIGNCGNPPQDDGRTIAAIAIGLTAVAWFVVPLVFVAVLSLVH